MDKVNYTVDELVNDYSFRRMAQGSASNEELNYWNNWIEKSDENRHKAQQALSEIAGFKFKDPEIKSFEQEWDKLFKSTIGKSESQRTKPIHRDFKIRWIHRVAAIFLLVSFIGIGAYLYSDKAYDLTQLDQITQKNTVITQEGEQKTLRFTKGAKSAKIVLNSNSTITYDIGLLHNQTIGVTLEGEAYFVAEEGISEDYPTFSVNTPDGIIEDIGTKFLVTVERDYSRVVLQEGLVRVKPNEGDEAQREFNVSKNQMVEFNNVDILKRESLNSTFYTSWATGFMEFDKTKISKFADFVERQFKIKVQVVDEDLNDVTINGAVYFHSMTDLVRTVSKVVGTPVYQSEDRDTLYIGNQSEVKIKSYLNR